MDDKGKKQNTFKSVQGGGKQLYVGLDRHSDMEKTPLDIKLFKQSETL